MRRVVRPFRMTRRDFLRASLVVGGAALGSAAFAASAAPGVIAAPRSASLTPQVRPPEPNPKHGGTLRIAGPFTVPHFDMYQGAWATPMINMYSLLVRKNPADGFRTIVPDLAERWDTSPDGRTYTFYLRGGVKWHDGSPFSAADVVATYSRAIAPPPGISIVQKDMLAMIEGVEAVDAATVRFRLKYPAPFFLEVLTGGTNLLQSVPIYPKKALDENNNDLRQVIAPGTGPFKLKEHLAAEKWVFERNPDYWDPELPYVDTLELLHVPQLTDRGTAVLTGQADVTWNSSVDTWREAQQRGGFITAKVPSLAAHTAHINNERKPFNDRRVRRAIFLAVSHQNIFNAYQDQEHINVGRWMSLAAPVSPSLDDILKLPGYRPDKSADIEEARRLMAEAGYPDGFGPIDLVTAAVPWASDIMGPAFQDEIKRTLNITSTIRLVERALLAEEYKNGSFDILVETQLSSNIADPTPMWNQYLRCGATSNWSRYCNPEFDKLLDQISSELDETKRRDLFNQAMDLLDQDAPFYVTGFTEHSVIARDYVKGIAADQRVHTEWGRVDTLWLDK